MKKSVFLIFCLFVITSCSTRKEIVYFEDIEDQEFYELLKQFEPEIEVNDVLRINVFSLNQEVASPFNLSLNSNSNRQSSLGGGSIGTTGGGGNNNAILDGYLVDIDGNIQFPVLGEVHVKGKTREDLEEFLTIRIKKYVKDAVVQVRIVNFKVTVMGEVQNKGVMRIADERVSIPQVLAMAGGITYGGKRENILIIRTIDGNVSYGRVDITNTKDVFRNPYFYLKQNDIVYVEPTYRQVKSAGFITSYTGLISLASTVFSLIVLLTR